MKNIVSSLRLPAVWLPPLLLFAALLSFRSGFTLATYPWLFPDSFDWIANGVAYANPPIPFETSDRGLFLTLLIGGLWRLGLADAIPLAGTAAFAALLLVVHRGLRRLSAPLIADIATVLLAFSSPLILQSAFVGADVLSVLFLSGMTFAFVRYLIVEENRDLVEAALWAGFGIHTQYIEVVFLPFLALFLCCKGGKGRLQPSLGRLLSAVFSRGFVLAVAAGLASAFLLLLPRLVLFHEIYAERVKHMSLVSPSFKHVLRYLVGLSGQLSLPTVLLAVCGSLIGLTSTRYQILTAVVLAWWASVGGFFVFLYSWFDTRFVVYLTVPAAVLEAIALERLLLAIRSRVGGLLAPFAAFALIAGFALVQLVRPESDAFSGMLQVLPHTALFVDENGVRSTVTIDPSVVLLDERRKSERFRRLAAEHQLDETAHSPAAAELFQKLRELPASLDAPPLYYQSVESYDEYPLKNRNILYFGSRVDTSIEAAATAKAVSSRRYRYLVSRRTDLRKLFTNLSPSLIHAEVGSYLVVDARAAADAALLRKTPPGVVAVEVRESPESLFDGVVNDASDFSAAPLDEPMVVRLDPQTRFRSARVYLYDFDGRRYRFTARTIDSSGSSERVYQSAAEGDAGLVQFALPEKSLKEIDLIGTSNSDTAQNPANRIFHVKELELVPAQ